MKKICVVTGSRADFGLLRWLMAAIRTAPGMALQVVATGSHLSPEFGLTAQEIEQAGFAIDRRIEILLSSDTGAGVAKSTGLGLIGFADAFQDLRPDLVVLLGDRFEILAAATAALLMRLPVAHLHGGEKTEGAFDDAIRHAITKMSNLHFVATEEYRQRVIQLGENPGDVHVVGALGLDGLIKAKRLTRQELEASLGFELGARSMIVTFHPETLSPGIAERQVAELLAALDAFGDFRIVFTLPNADPEGRAITSLIESFVESHPNARAYPSLGQLRYQSLVATVDVVVGNSSSGIIEVPSLGRPTVNIGDRQKGRLRAASVIDCQPDRSEIRQAIDKALSADFQASLEAVSNPYGTGGASDAIARVIAQTDLAALKHKTFHDLEFARGPAND